MAMASTHTSCFDSVPFSPFLNSLMEGNCLNNHHLVMTTTNNTAITYSSPLESLDSDQSIKGSGYEVPDEFFAIEEWENLNEQQQQYMDFGQGQEFFDVGGCSNIPMEVDNSRSIRNTRNVKEKVAFRMKSEIDVVDDGYKWRKYGKKMVKNNPNPRNYYRCAIESCPVKKRVERDRDDMDYVITTYEGNHNHQTQTNY